MTLQEMIAAAQSRLDAAKNTSDEGAQAKVEAELSALKSVESAGYTRQADLNSLAGTARSEGKTQGEKEARKALLDSFGIPDDENADAELKRIKELRDGQKTEAERYKSQAETLQAEKEAEAKRAGELQERLRDRDRRDAIQSALAAAEYQGKIAHALNAIDHSKVEEKDGVFDATQAVKALQDDEFPGFKAQLENPPDSQRTRKNGIPSDGKSHARRRQDQINERRKNAR